MEDQNNAEVENVPPKHRISKMWTTSHTVENKVALDLFFREARFWRVKKKVSSNGGEKTFYYCNMAGTGQNRCPAELSAFKHNAKKKLLFNGPTNMLIQKLFAQWFQKFVKKFEST